MTSQRQTDANRRNALLSTGPRTENGKERARQNAFRHGLTAETVILGIEDAAQYDAFESEIVTEYDPKSVVERELTYRLASLLWRLRRSTLIETGLLRSACGPAQVRDEGADFRADVPLPAALRRWIGATAKSEQPDNRMFGHRDSQQIMAQCFLQLADMSGHPLERVGRYETSLWRQFVQVLFAIDEAKRHQLIASRHRFSPYPPQW
jgi:hypothetical protein